MKRLFLLVTALLLFALPPTRTASAEERNIPILKAAEVACGDFSKRLAAEGKSSWEFAAYVSNLGNYNIGLSEDRSAYVVVFQLRQPDDLRKHHSRIIGGGGEYRISKATLEIAQFVGYE